MTADLAAYPATFSYFYYFLYWLVDYWGFDYCWIVSWGLSCVMARKMIKERINNVLFMSLIFIFDYNL